MHLQTERITADHGTREWTGRFVDGYAELRCPICGDTIGLNPYAERVYTRLAWGAVAQHRGYITPAILQAALEAELWPQSAWDGVQLVEGAVNLAVGGANE